MVTVPLLPVAEAEMLMVGGVIGVDVVDSETKSMVMKIDLWI